MSKPYTDPTTGEWVGEHETTDAEGEVHRQTEWFNNEAAARTFIRTGRRGTEYLPRALLGLPRTGKGVRTMSAIHPSRHAGWCPVNYVWDAKDPDDCACGVHDEEPEMPPSPAFNIDVLPRHEYPVRTGAVVKPI